MGACQRLFDPANETGSEVFRDEETAASMTWLGHGRPLLVEVKTVTYGSKKIRRTVGTVHAFIPLESSDD